MRNGVAAAAGAVLTSVFVAGCGGGLVGGEEQSPAESNNSSAPAPSSETKESERTAPAKSVNVSDQCVLLTEVQRQELGADQEPEPRESVGKQGCQYRSGEAGADGGWAVFSAANPDQNLSDFKQERGGLAEETEVAGYPAAQVKTGDSNCIMLLDVSDTGSLFVNVLSRDGGPDPCEHATKFAEAAVKNLPDA